MEKTGAPLKTLATSRIEKKRYVVFASLHPRCLQNNRFFDKKYSFDGIHFIPHLLYTFRGITQWLLNQALKQREELPVEDQRKGDEINREKWLATVGGMGVVLVSILLSMATGSFPCICC
jgi:hypothetical protein